MPRWTVEGNDAAIVAQAILSGEITGELQTYKDFFDSSSTGPGAAIGEKYSYHTVKGQRNLRLNVEKLRKKIQVWLTNKKDVDTGKRKLSQADQSIQQKINLTKLLYLRSSFL